MARDETVMLKGGELKGHLLEMNYFFSFIERGNY